MNKTITVPILNHEYKVVVCLGSVKYLRKVMMEHYYDESVVGIKSLTNETSNKKGITFKQNRCYPVIWVDIDLLVHDFMDTLSHEAVHAVDFIFEELGEGLNIYTSEVFAHSVGAIVRETVKVLKLKK